MNIDKDHVRRRIRQTLKDKEIDRPGNLTRDTCQIWENLHNVGRTMEPKSVWILKFPLAHTKALAHTNQFYETGKSMSPI